MRHSGRDAGIQAMDGNQPVAQVFDLGSVQAQSLPSLDAGFRHPCRNDAANGLGGSPTLENPAMHHDNLVKMANDISHFFQSDPDPASAVQGMADHLRRFWEPRMRKAIIAHCSEGGEGLTDLAKEAVKKIAADHASLGACGDG
jgi:formate dehydrogenase subunit delta